MKKGTIVGDNIRRLRLGAGITQEELALRSGLSQGYVNQVESGKRRFTQKSLEMITEALSVPISELFKTEGHQQSRVPKKDITGYGKKQITKKDFLVLLNGLPEHIVGHYYLLMKLEVEIWKKDQV